MCTGVRSLQCDPMPAWGRRRRTCLGAEPQSSVMISRMLVHPWAARRVAATTAFDSVAFSLITPPNFGSGGGKLFAADGGGGSG